MSKFNRLYRYGNSFQFYDRWFFSFSFLKWYDNYTRSVVLGSKITGNHSLLELGDVTKTLSKNFDNTFKHFLFLNQNKQLPISERLLLNLAISQKASSLVLGKNFNSSIPVVFLLDRLETRTGELKVSKLFRVEKNITNTSSYLEDQNCWSWVQLNNTGRSSNVRFRLLNNVKSGYSIRVLNQLGFLPKSKIFIKHTNNPKISLYEINSLFLGRLINGTCLQFNSQSLNAVVSLDNKIQNWNFFFIHVFFGVLKEINICLNRVNPPLNSGFIIRKHFLKKDVINKNIRCSKLLSDLILLESREGPSLIYKRLSVLA